MAACVVAGEVSATELLRCTRKQLTRVQPCINGLLRPLESLARVQLAKAQLAKARLTHQPLAGAPFLINDSVRDSAPTFDILSDPTGAAPPLAPWAAPARRAPRRPRVAFSIPNPIGRPSPAEAAAAAHAAAALRERLGHHVEESAPAVDDHALARAFQSLYFG